MRLDINLYLWCNNVMEHLRELVDNYQPSEQTVNLVRSTRLVLLAGISGAGKDTVKRALISKNPIFHDIVSHTTRQPRSNNNMLERDGVDYHFIDNYVAENMLQAGEFVRLSLSTVRFMAHLLRKFKGPANLIRLRLRI